MAINKQDQQSLIKEGEFRGQVLQSLSDIKISIKSLTENVTSIEVRTRNQEALTASQGGAIHALGDSVKQFSVDFRNNEKRVDKLENYKYWLMGLGALLIFIIGLIIQLIHKIMIN